MRTVEIIIEEYTVKLRITGSYLHVRITKNNDLIGETLISLKEGVIYENN